MDIDREGLFFGQIFAWGIRESNTTASTAVTLSAQLQTELDGAGNEVRDCAVEGAYPNAIGDIWYIGKNGKIRGDVYEHLKKWLGWNGDEAQLLIRPGEPDALPLPPPCRITVKRDDYYADEPRYRIDSIGVRGHYIPHVEGDEAVALLDRIKAKKAGTWKPPEPESPSPETPASTGDVPF